MILWVRSSKMRAAGLLLLMSCGDGACERPLDELDADWREAFRGQECVAVVECEVDDIYRFTSEQSEYLNYWWISARGQLIGAQFNTDAVSGRSCDDQTTFGEPPRCSQNAQIPQECILPRQVGAGECADQDAVERWLGVNSLDEAYERLTSCFAQATCSDGERDLVAIAPVNQAGHDFDGDSAQGIVDVYDAATRLHVTTAHAYSARNAPSGGPCAGTRAAWSAEALPQCLDAEWSLVGDCAVSLGVSEGARAVLEAM